MRDERFYVEDGKRIMGKLRPMLAPFPFLLFMSLLFTGVGARAQVAVDATIDSIEILIGEQVHVTVKATVPEQSKVVWPTLKERQYLTPGVEIVGISPEVSEKIGNGKTESARVYTLTSFDGNLYYLPPFTVEVDGKQYKSKSLALKVVEVEVDTTHMENFFGPKDVQDNPFSWAEWGPLFWLSLLMLLIAAATFYLYVQLRAGKPVAMPKLKMVRRLLPHQKAMKEIEQIKADNMTTQGDQKEYYTKLTDTLRKYIEERYGFRAMEMTSAEIIDRLTANGDMKSLAELTELFRTADLVKFAKYSTLINENDMNLVNAIDFINSTKMENQPAEEMVRPKLTEEQERDVKTRRTLRVVIAVGVAVCAALLAYMAYSVYQLLQ